MLYSRVETVVVVALFLVFMALRAAVLGIQWMLLVAAWPLRALAAHRHSAQEVRQGVLLLLGCATLFGPLFALKNQLLAAGLSAVIWFVIMALGWFTIPRPDIVTSPSGLRVIRPCKARW